MLIGLLLCPYEDFSVKSDLLAMFSLPKMSHFEIGPHHQTSFRNTPIFSSVSMRVYLFRAFLPSTRGRGCRCGDGGHRCRACCCLGGLPATSRAFGLSCWGRDGRNCGCGEARVACESSGVSWTMSRGPQRESPKRPMRVAFASFRSLGLLFGSKAPTRVSAQIGAKRTKAKKLPCWLCY